MSITTLLKLPKEIICKHMFVCVIEGGREGERERERERGEREEISERNVS